MVTTAIICIVIICLAQGYPGGWLGGFVEMGSMAGLAAIPGLPWLLGSAVDGWFGTERLATGLGWAGTAVLVLLALAAVAQGAARLVNWWRGDDEALADSDHF